MWEISKYCNIFIIFLCIKIYMQGHFQFTGKLMRYIELNSNCKNVYPQSNTDRTFFYSVLVFFLLLLLLKIFGVLEEDVLFRKANNFLTRNEKRKYILIQVIVEIFCTNICDTCTIFATTKRHFVKHWLILM